MPYLPHLRLSRIEEPRIPREQATFKKAGRISRNQQPTLDLGEM